MIYYFFSKVQILIFWFLGLFYSFKNLDQQHLYREHSFDVEYVARSPRINKSMTKLSLKFHIFSTILLRDRILMNI